MPPAVLVVEDDSLIASSLTRALAANGYEARSAGTVAAAVEEIDRQPPSLVLLDLGLPDGDGMDVADHVVSRHPDVPVIVLTARDSEVDVVLGLQSGAVDYVVKPSRLAELLARIDAHLQLGGAISQATTDRRREEMIVVGDLVIDPSISGPSPP